MKCCVCILILCGLLQSITAPLAAQENVPWPTGGWHTSTPEEQGMNSEKLAGLWNMLQVGEPDAIGTAMIPYVPGTSTFIHSALVIRHGNVVMDASVYPYTNARPHEMFSTTKSVLSALVGIAIDQGYITGVDQSIWDFFPKENVANMDELKAAITLRHLLTHTSGLGVDQAKVYTLDTDRKTVVQYILDSPMANAPGTVYLYLDSGADLVSALLQQATGMSAFEFAQANLFGPLGITDAEWVANPQGVNWGSTALAISGYDLAKIGYLYLHNGEWDGQQIISRAWVEASITDGLEPLQPHFWEGYSNFWYDGHIGNWFNEPESSTALYKGFAAFGWGMQILAVIPDLDLIMVTTGDLQAASVFSGLPDFILPSVESEDPLPANPQAFADLQAAIDATVNPVPSRVTAMPAAAQDVSGKTYVLEDNALGWKSIGLEFGDQEAILTVVAGDSRLELPVGLDGVYRVSTAGMPFDPAYSWRDNVPLATKGAWQSDEAFALESWDVVGMSGLAVTMHFDPFVISATRILNPEVSLSIQARAQ